MHLPVSQGSGTAVPVDNLLLPNINLPIIFLKIGKIHFQHKQIINIYQLIEDTTTNHQSWGYLIMLKTFEVSTGGHNELVDITSEVQRVVKSAGVKSGICVVYVPHTTAGVTINENADPSVRHDILMECSKLVPEHDRDYRHSEGNSAGHIKSTLFGSSVHLLIDRGALVLGTWQGIYFGEFDGPRRRRVHVKVIEG